VLPLPDGLAPPPPPPPVDVTETPVPIIEEGVPEPPCCGPRLEPAVVQPPPPMVML
jgi:hypothetical protein